MLHFFVRAFGCQVVNPKAIIQALPGPFAHADKAVRSEASLLVQELHKWCGASVLTALQSHLKSLQLKEISEACAQSPASQPTPSRYLRGQGPIPDIANESMLTDFVGSSHESMPSAMEIDSTAAATITSSQTVPKVMDAYDLVQPVDVMSKLPSLDGLTSSAWKERKECLDSILTVVKVPRIQSDSHLGELVQALAARLADVNVMCVVVAANVIEAIACGLRAAFASYRAVVLPALLERCKERKASVLDALRAALDSLRFSLSPAQLASELIPEDLTPFATHKNPSVKAELFAWLARFMARSSAGKKEFKALCELALPAMDDGNTEVRDAAADLLGVCWRLLGEVAASALLTDRLDKIKLNKIKERSASSVTSNTGAGNTGYANIGTGNNLPPLPSKEIPSKSVAKPVLQAPAAPPPTTQPNKKAALMVSASPVSTVSEEEALSICTEWLGEALVAGLSDSVWKNRLQAMDDIFKVIDETVELPVGMSAEAVVKFFAVRPGWKESNFQVTGRVINCLLRLSKFTFFSSEAMACLLSGLVEKLSDSKLKNDCSELFMVLAEQVGLTQVISAVSAAFASQKSPKIQADILKWLQSTIEAFGVVNLQFNSSGLLDACRTGLKASNPAVRQATVGLAGCLRLALGPDFRSLFADLPAATLAVLDGEFNRVASSGEGLAPPTRMSSMMPFSTSAVTSSTTAMTSESLQSPSNDDLVPRVNINGQVTDALLVRFNDASWKVRKEALDECAAMLQSAAMRIKYTGHELFTALKGRYLDSNKNLTVQALELTAAFAEAMGSAFDKPFKTIMLAPLLQCLADAKPQVRQAGLKALDKALLVCPLNGILAAIPTALAPDSPNLRRELMTWIASGPLTGCKEELLDLVGPVTLCLQDRSGDVRKAAQLLLAAMLDVLSVEAMKRACTEQQPKFLPSLTPILEAARGKKASISNIAPAPILSSSPAPAAPRTPQRSASMRPSIGGGSAVSATSARPTTPLRPSHSLQNLEEAPSQIQQQQQECPITTTDPAAKIIRAEREKLHRWSLDAPKREIVDTLREQMIPHFASSLLGRLFSEDFREQTMAMTRLEDWLSVATDDLTRARLTANSDLLVKYLSLRFFESANTIVFSKALELTESVMSCLDACNYRLTEYEAAIFLPILISKVIESE